MDAAWDAVTRRCGIGCVFTRQTHVPKLNSISDSRCSVSSVLMAEALVIRSAVMYAAAPNVKTLMILSDSLSLVNMVKEGKSIPVLFGIIFDIYHFSSTFVYASFTYVPRLSNVFADFVAKSALLLLNSSSSFGG